MDGSTVAHKEYDNSSRPSCTETSTSNALTYIYDFSTELYVTSTASSTCNSNTASEASLTVVGVFCR